MHVLKSLAVKRLVGVAPEMDFRKCALQLPKKTSLNLALKARGDIPRNPKQGHEYQDRTHVSAKNFKKKTNKTLL